MKQIDIYTDGACSGNPGPGGWGAVLIYNGTEKHIAGGASETTNNRMEMQAVIEALKLLKEPCVVKLHSDSAYIINAFNQKWIDNWQRKHWRNSKKEPVLNQDLWQEILKWSQPHKITWIKVKGHSDNKYNNICDELAREQVEQK